MPTVKQLLAQTIEASDKLRAARIGTN